MEKSPKLPLDQLLPKEQLEAFNIAEFQPICADCGEETSGVVGQATFDPNNDAMIEIQTWSYCLQCRSGITTQSRFHDNGTVVHKTTQGWPGEENPTPKSGWATKIIRRIFGS